ncbi:30S ribosomal protein S20, partial [Striga asiatica]
MSESLYPRLLLSSLKISKSQCQIRKYEEWLKAGEKMYGGRQPFTSGSEQKEDGPLRISNLDSNADGNAAGQPIYTASGDRRGGENVSTGSQNVESQEEEGKMQNMEVIITHDTGEERLVEGAIVGETMEITEILTITDGKLDKEVSCEIPGNQERLMQKTWRRSAKRVGRLLRNPDSPEAETPISGDKR